MSPSRPLRTVDRERPEPLYHQLATALRERILSGEWPPGTKIPTEDQLGEMYGVSRVTIRSAVRTLVEAGFLERGQGRGTFVREPTLTAGERGLLSFSDEMRALGLRPGSRMLELDTVPAPAGVAERLALEPRAPVHRIRRLRTGDGRPIGLQTAHLPAERFVHLPEAMNEGASLYRVLQDRYGVVLGQARETFSVTQLAARDARTLGVEPGACAFHVERVAVDEHGPFEYTLSRMRGDRYRIQWVLRNPEQAPPAPHDQGAPT